MGKGKSPRKRRDPVTESTGDEKEIDRQTEEKAQLVPPARRPPTAVGAETPPPPPREPPRLVLSNLIHAVQLAVGAMLDLADAAADIITKQVEGRASRNSASFNRMCGGTGGGSMQPPLQQTGDLAGSSKTTCRPSPTPRESRPIGDSDADPAPCDFFRCAGGTRPAAPPERIDNRTNPAIR